MVIGSGGSTIKEIVSEFDVTIDISDDGTVSIGGVESVRIENAIEKIQSIIKDVEVGDVYQGKVVKLMDFGAFVNILPGKDGLVHISEISDERVDSVESAYEVGQEVEVIVKKIDNQNRIDLSARVEKYLKEVDDELNQSSSISITRIRRSMAWKEMLAQSISEEEIQRRVESFAGVHPSTGEQKSKKQLEGVAFRQLAKEKFGSIEPPPDFRTARELREEIYLQRWSS